MANDFVRRTPRDRGRINLEEPREVRYWANALSVTEAHLRAAVSVAGDATPAVQQYLAGQSHHRGDMPLGSASSIAKKPYQPQPQQQHH